MEQSSIFLVLCQESDVYKETDIYYDQKLEDLGGRHIIPPENLLLSNITNTLET